MSATRSEVLGEISRVCSGEKPLSEFADWMAPIVWGVDSCEDAALVELVTEVGLLLAEYTSGHRTRLELLRLLGEVATPADARPSTAGSVPAPRTQ